MDAQKAKAEAMLARPEGTVPAFAANFPPTIRSDGELWLIAEQAGAVVAVQPKAWAGMKFTADVAAKPEAGLLFAEGVNLPAMQQKLGTIETNDPTFDGSLLGASTSSSIECRRPESAPFEGVKPYMPLIAAAIVAGAIIFVGIAAVLLIRHR